MLNMALINFNFLFTPSNALMEFYNRNIVSYKLLLVKLHC